MLTCTHACNCNQRSFFADTFFLLEFVVCLLSPQGQIFIQIRWRIYALLYHPSAAYMWNAKDVFVSVLCLRILSQRRCCFAARLWIPCWQILVLRKKGPLIGSHLHFKNELCAAWTTRWTHLLMAFGVKMPVLVCASVITLQSDIQGLHITSESKSILVHSLNSSLTKYRKVRGVSIPVFWVPSMNWS